MLMSYPPEVEKKMKTFYNTLNEKDRRRYAAIEAMKFGHGGITYISEVLGCFRHTVAAGIKEIMKLPEDSCYDPKIREEGGGRKKYEEKFPELDLALLDVLKNHTAGDPQNGNVIWTNLTLEEIAKKLLKEHNFEVSHTVIKRLLKKHKFKRRKALKKKSLKAVQGRNEQFVKIARLKKNHLKSKNPVISIDTKKKELIGNIYREGKLLTREEIETLDHDFPSDAEGVCIPHCIYDEKQN